MSAQQIHRTDFEKREDEFNQKQTLCSVELRVPTKFSPLAKQCAPTHDQACSFENVQVEDVNEMSGKNVAYDHPELKLLGCGVGRCAYAFNLIDGKHRCVVKFARSARRDGTVIGYGEYNGVTGEESNTYEVASYTLAPDEVKQWLAPVIAHAPAKAKQGYKWIVQPMARTLKRSDQPTDEMKDISRYEARDIQRKITNGIREAGAECSDMHLGNIGILMDKYPVLIDYGFSVRCRIAKPKPVVKAKAPRRLSEFKPLTKHRGRHGLKRPRGIQVPMGVLTRRRRILWQEAGKLRRQARKLKGVGSDVDEMKRLLDDARFLEQQAWHFQTKNLKKTMKDPNRMIALLNQTQREAMSMTVDGTSGRSSEEPRFIYQDQFETRPSQA